MTRRTTHELTIVLLFLLLLLKVSSLFWFVVILVMLAFALDICVSGWCTMLPLV
jgi:hypothetical protein